MSAKQMGVMTSTDEAFVGAYGSTGYSKTLGVVRAASLETESFQGVQFKPQTNLRSKKPPILDRVILARMGELLEDIEESSAETVSVTIEALRGAVTELWTSAAKASPQHQALLALVEGSLAQAVEVSRNLAAAWRGAVLDLALPAVTETAVDINRSQILENGYAPLAFLDDSDEGNPDGHASKA